MHYEGPGSPEREAALSMSCRHSFALGAMEYGLQAHLQPAKARDQFLVAITSVRDI